MLPLIAKRKAAIVLMHMKGEPKTMQRLPHYPMSSAKSRIFFDNDMPAP